MVAINTTKFCPNTASERCQSHKWCQILNITLLPEEANMRVSLVIRSAFTSALPDVCLQSHRQGSDSTRPVKSNTRFLCQTQILTVSHTQTLSQSLPWYNRQRVLQPINGWTPKNTQKHSCLVWFNNGEALCFKNLCLISGISFKAESMMCDWQLKYKEVIHPWSCPNIADAGSGRDFSCVGEQACLGWTQGRRDKTRWGEDT